MHTEIACATAYGQNQCPQTGTGRFSSLPFYLPIGPLLAPSRAATSLLSRLYCTSVFLTRTTRHIAKRVSPIQRLTAERRTPIKANDFTRPCTSPLPLIVTSCPRSCFTLSVFRTHLPFSSHPLIFSSSSSLCVFYLFILFLSSRRLPRKCFVGVRR